MSQLSKKIMRRVYYAFCLRFLTHPVSIHSAIIAASFVILSQAISIPSIWHNLMAVKVGEAAGYLLAALSSTQFAVQLLLSIMAAAMISLIIKLLRSRRFEMVQEREAEWI